MKIGTLRNGGFGRNKDYHCTGHLLRIVKNMTHSMKAVRSILGQNYPLLKNTSKLLADHASYNSFS